MATFGERKSKIFGKGYENDPLKNYAQSFANTVNSVQHEAASSYYKDPTTCLMNRSSKAALKKFFVEGTYDVNDPFMTAEKIEEHVNDMENLFENDIEAMNEATALGTFNPLVGLGTPMHKNIMMNMVFDKGSIPKAVATTPKFSRTMERRLLVKPDGTEIDMFLEQNKLTAAMRSVNPYIAVDLTLPELGTTNIVVDKLGGAELVDHIDVESYVGAVKVENVCFEIGDTLPDPVTGIVADGGPIAESETIKDAWYYVDLRFTPGFGELNRQFMHPIKIQVKKKDVTVKVEVIDDIIAGAMVKDRLTLQTLKGKIAAVRFMAKLDASHRTIDTCTVKWDERSEFVEIGTDEGINTTISPEELKDISALYNVNQLTKVMSIMKTVLANRKDDTIKEELDLSYARLDARSKFKGRFDYAPRDGYALDPEEWRKKTFFVYLDDQVTKMLQVLNDPNMSISVFGDPRLIRRITPTEYTYQAPASLGAVELDFTKTVVTSDKRVYQFVGSDKMRGSEQFIITLCPRNTNRIIYIIYDYQMYISNEIRQNSNPALPNICAFERYKFSSYQPIQGRIDVVNPLGIRAGDGSETVGF